MRATLKADEALVKLHQQAKFLYRDHGLGKIGPCLSFSFRRSLGPAPKGNGPPQAFDSSRPRALS
jgi:hypothetical protein